MADIKKITLGSDTYDLNALKSHNADSSVVATVTATAPSSSSDNTTFPTSKAVWSAIANGITANDAMVFKGTIGSSESGATVTALPATHKQG